MFFYFWFIHVHHKRDPNMRQLTLWLVVAASLLLHAVYATDVTISQLSNYAFTMSSATPNVAGTFPNPQLTVCSGSGSCTNTLITYVFFGRSQTGFIYSDAVQSAEYFVSTSSFFLHLPAPLVFRRTFIGAQVSLWFIRRNSCTSFQMKGLYILTRIFPPLARFRL
jgi:hypothetical protein